MARAASKAAVARALAALEERGLTAASITIQPGGAVEIIPGAITALTAAIRTGKPADLDEWRERKNGRRAPERS